MTEDLNRGTSQWTDSLFNQLIKCTRSLKSFQNIFDYVSQKLSNADFAVIVDDPLLLQQLVLHAVGQEIRKSWNATGNYKPHLLREPYIIDNTMNKLFNEATEDIFEKVEDIVSSKLRKTPLFSRYQEQFQLAFHKLLINMKETNHISDDHMFDILGDAVHQTISYKDLTYHALNSTLHSTNNTNNTNNDDDVLSRSYPGNSRNTTTTTTTTINNNNNSSSSTGSTSIDTIEINNCLQSMRITDTTALNGFNTIANKIADAFTLMPPLLREKIWSFRLLHRHLNDPPLGPTYTQQFKSMLRIRRLPYDFNALGTSISTSNSISSFTTNYNNNSSSSSNYEYGARIEKIRIEQESIKNMILSNVKQAAFDALQYEGYRYRQKQQQIINENSNKNIIKPVMSYKDYKRHDPYRINNNNSSSSSSSSR